MIIGIHQSHYLPWLRYFHKIACSDLFIVMDDVDFTQRGWQNRNRIQSAHGPQLLTLPVRQPRGKPLASIELVDAERALATHARTIEQSYRRAPYFERYWPDLRPLFQTQWTRLVELNRAMLEALCHALGIQTAIRYSSEIPVQSMATQRLADLVTAVGGTRYLSGADAVQSYVQPEVMASAGVELVVQEWEPPCYRQQFAAAGFVPDLALIDLLFNEGERSREILLGAGGTTPWEGGREVT